MTSRSKQRFGSALEWWLRGAALRDLRAQRPSAVERSLLEQAESTLLVSWRVLAGLEPIPAATRGAVALPLVSTGLAYCLKVAAPGRDELAEVFAEREWQERFSNAGLSEAEQSAIREWLATGTTGEHDPAALAKSALIALRAALEKVQGTRRAIRRLLWRRVRIFSAALVVVAGMVALVAVAARGPSLPDLAAGKPWNASSAYPGFSAEGEKPARPIDGLFFSTTEESQPWWRVDLKKSYTVTAVEVVNRSDCCGERAHPLVLELSLDDKAWREVARRNDAFTSWTAKFAPTPARYVRVRSLRRTLLHLRDVKVRGTPK